MGLKKHLGTAAVALAGASLALCWVWTTGPPRTGFAGGGAASFTADDPLKRAVACDSAGRGADYSAIAALVARASDSDWRVRAAAFGALDRLRPLDRAVPPRDMPLAEREQLLLDWLDLTAPDLPICEAYASDGHLVLGATMVQRCQACHASPSAGSNCAGCHAQVHAHWSVSSHAQSLSHLRITTVDPRTRQVRPYHFGELRGIGCAACHSPSSQRTEAGSDICIYEFVGHDKARSCLPCHGDVQRQWEQWRAGPQPRHAVWPPGKIEMARSDKRSCIDCHMARGTESGVAEHHLSARRDLTLLRSGLHIQLRSDPARNRPIAAELILTNLAGHDYPTGTSRRAVEIHAEFDPVNMPPVTIARLARPHWSDKAETSIASPLFPGESRRYLISAPPTATRIRCRISYVRDRLTQPEVAIELATLELVMD